MGYKTIILKENNVCIYIDNNNVHYEEKENGNLVEHFIDLKQGKPSPI